MSLSEQSRTQPAPPVAPDGDGSALDRQRVVEIDRYQVLVDPPRDDLVALVEVAAQVADVPMATINLISDTSQHQIATKGFDASVCSREDSMCAAVLHEDEPVIVPDASQDERFRDNPFVTGVLGAVRFYATHQLTTPGGVIIGTLCVFDTVPRQLSAAQEDSLQKLADRVVDLLELELRSRELAASVVELEQARVELERSNQQLAAFAGQVSHDLRNPLTAVAMSLSMIEEEVDPESDDLQFLVRRARGGATRMQSMIDDLLAFARVGAELTREPVDLDEVAAEVHEDLETALVGAELTIDPLPTVPGDHVQLRAVLQNLVANAAKFTRPGQPARIEVRARPTVVLGPGVADPLDPEAGQGVDGWRVEVVDHGIGIPAEQRDRVFQPLARVATEVPGFGIGLATVRRIVEAHGGDVGVAETAGGGATVWFALPL